MLTLKHIVKTLLTVTQGILYDLQITPAVQKLTLTTQFAEELGIGSIEKIELLNRIQDALAIDTLEQTLLDANSLLDLLVAFKGKAVVKQLKDLRYATLPLVVDGVFDAEQQLDMDDIHIDKPQETLWRRCRFFLGRMFYTIYWVILLIVLVLPMLIIILLLPYRAAGKLALWCCRLLVLLSGCAVTIRGRQHIRSQHQIIIANHASFTDILFLNLVLPTNAVYVAKSDLLKIPLLSHLLRKFNCITVYRQDIKSRRVAKDNIVQTLKAGLPVVIFPEATFTAYPGIRPFKMGAFKAAVETGFPVCVVALTNTRRLWPAESYLLRRSAVTITIHQEIKPQQHGWKEAARLRDHCRQLLSHMTGEQLLPAQLAQLQIKGLKI